MRGWVKTPLYIFCLLVCLLFSHHYIFFKQMYLLFYALWYVGQEKQTEPCDFNECDRLLALVSWGVIWVTSCLWILWLYPIFTSKKNFFFQINFFRTYFFSITIPSVPSLTSSHPRFLKKNLKVCFFTKCWEIWFGAFIDCDLPPPNNSEGPP